MRMSDGLLTPCRVDDDRWSELSFDVRQLCTMAVKTAFATAGQIPHGEVSILLTNDALMSALNSKYRGKKKATNVLSFSAVLKDQGYIGENQPRLWGDVAVSIDRVTLEAKHQGKSVRDHTAHLMVHGTLHLLGFDHQEGLETGVMEQLEILSLAQLGVDDPYLATERSV